MFNYFEADTADELWLKIFRDFNAQTPLIHSGRGGESLEILHVSLCIRNPRERWVPSRFPALNPAFALAEVVWILMGRNDASFLNYFNSLLPKFAGSTATYHGAYGHRLINNWQINQIHRAYHALQANSLSRQVVLQIWDPEKDLPNLNGDPVACDIPCNISSMLKVRSGKLEWLQIMRSNDLFRGLPYNIIQFSFLQELMASWLGIEVGSYNHVSDSLHLYRDLPVSIWDSELVKAPGNTDRFSESYDQSMVFIRLVSDLVDSIVTKRVSSHSLVEKFMELNVSRSWRNIAAILVAEACRKRGDNQSFEIVMGLCCNPLYNFLVERWIDRVGK